jgi:hypothetical protein
LQYVLRILAILSNVLCEPEDFRFISPYQLCERTAVAYTGFIHKRGFVGSG